MLYDAFKREFNYVVDENKQDMDRGLIDNGIETNNLTWAT